MILTVKDLLARLNEIAAAHGDGCLIGVDDADTWWEIPVEELRFDANTKRVLLKAEYHGASWPEELAKYKP